jgi:hypothetical protein
MAEIAWLIRPSRRFGIRLFAGMCPFGIVGFIGALIASPQQLGAGVGLLLLFTGIPLGYTRLAFIEVHRDAVVLAIWGIRRRISRSAISAIHVDRQRVLLLTETGRRLGATYRQVFGDPQITELAQRLDVPLVTRAAKPRRTR